MSPSEFDLRAALREGEGDSVNPDRVIAQARQLRHERRTRLGSIAAVVAVVAGIGSVGGVILANGNQTQRTASGTTGASPGPVAPAGAGPVENTYGARGSVQPSTGMAIAPGPLADAAGIACPATLPRLDAGAAGTGSLFSGPVEAIKVCVYATSTGAPVMANGSALDAIYTGQIATQIAQSIDAASTVPPPEPCPLYLLGNTRTLVIIGVSRSGVAMAPITTELLQNPCDRPITNGISVRYDWTPPASMLALVGQADGGTPVVSPPMASGSPAR